MAMKSSKGLRMLFRSRCLVAALLPYGQFSLPAGNVQRVCHAVEKKKDTHKNPFLSWQSDCLRPHLLTLQLAGKEIQRCSLQLQLLLILSKDLT